MKITYSGNKISAKTCEINNFEYLQKLIYTEMLKICKNIYTTLALFNHPKINTTDQLLKVILMYLHWQFIS